MWDWKITMPARDGEHLLADAEHLILCLPHSQGVGWAATRLVWRNSDHNFLLFACQVKEVKAVRILHLVGWTVQASCPLADPSTEAAERQQVLLPDEESYDAKFCNCSADRRERLQQHHTALTRRESPQATEVIPSLPSSDQRKCLSCDAGWWLHNAED